MKQTIHIILYVIMVVLATGCGKQEVITEIVPENHVLINVEAPQIDGWSLDESVYTRSYKDSNAKTKGDDGLDMEINTYPDSTNRIKESATTRWANIDDNTTFRVVAYQCASAATITASNYKGYGDYKLLSNGTVQTTKSLTLPMGTYTFVCYSYGNSSAIAAFTNSSVSVAATNGQNFMTCIKPNIVIDNVGSIYTLSNIVFSHHSVRYRVCVTAQAGRMDKVTACSATLTLPSNSATYSFTNNALTTNATAAIMSATWSVPNAVAVYSDYIYILPQSSKNITINLNTTIGGKAFADKSFTLSGLTLNANGTYCSNVSFTTTEGYIVGGYIWANGNLVYSSASGIHFFYSNTMDCSRANNANDYFTYNNPFSSNPELVLIWSDLRDPCRRVAPANTWRIPTLQDFTALLKAGYVEESDRTTYGGVLILPHGSFMRYTTGYPHEPYYDAIGYYLSTTYPQCLQNGSFGIYSTVETLAFPIRCVRN